MAYIPRKDYHMEARQQRQMGELFHVGLTVSDLDRSYAFYHDAIGMNDGYDWGSRTDWSGAQIKAGPSGVRYITIKTEAFDRLTSNPGSEIRTAYLRDSTGLLLQLTQYVRGGDAPVELRHNRAGSPHFCFYIDDVVAKRRELEERGDVRLLSDLVQITSEMRSFYAADPDGVPVEFLQRTPAQQAGRADDTRGTSSTKARVVTAEGR
jgi:catechol 2,3-dioxygenase-like lactoylglutathione lyase family enzyme